MKKILYSFVFMLLLLTTSCDSKLEKDGIKVACDYLSSLDSYSLDCDMTIYRANKDVKMDVTVDYLKPSYYRVTFSNNNGHEQIIVKNADGVYVLTPSLNKEFKFDSQWPLNSSHAYLIEALISTIKEDTSATFELNGDTLIINSKLNNINDSATKLKFYYDTKNKKPQKVLFLDDNDNEKILVEFNEFNPNKELKAEMFNSKLIMEEKSNSKENTNDEKTEETSIDITCGYVCEGVNLSDYIIEDNYTVLCYTGDINYTVVVQKVDLYSSVISMDEYNDYDYLDSGLLLIGENYSRYYVDDLEVSIYSNNLNRDEVSAIASDITMS